MGGKDPYSASKGAAEIIIQSFIHSYFKKNNKMKIKNYVFKNFNQIKSAVGCYNLEGVGIDLFDNISLCYFNVLGLDIINFLKLIRKI